MSPVNASPKLDTRKGTLRRISPTLIGNVEKLALGEEYLIYFTFHDPLIPDDENFYITGVCAGGNYDLNDPSGYLFLIITHPGNYKGLAYPGERIELPKKIVTLVLKCKPIVSLDLYKNYDVYIRVIMPHPSTHTIERVTGTFISGTHYLTFSQSPSSLHIIIKLTEPSGPYQDSPIGSEISIAHSAITHVKEAIPKSGNIHQVDPQRLQLQVLREQLITIPDVMMQPTEKPWKTMKP